MTTFNRLYRAPKFHLCVHTGDKGHIDFEPAKYRKTQYTFVSYGTGQIHMFTGDEHEVIADAKSGDLLDFRKFIDSSVIIKAREDYRIVSFNSWRKTDVWKGRLLEQNETQISSSASYSTLVCLKGTFKIKGKDVPEMAYVDLKKDTIYNIDCNNAHVGLFEEINERVEW